MTNLRDIINRNSLSVTTDKKADLCWDVVVRSFNERVNNNPSPHKNEWMLTNHDRTYIRWYNIPQCPAELREESSAYITDGKAVYESPERGGFNIATINGGTFIIEIKTYTLPVRNTNLWEKRRWVVYTDSPLSEICLPEEVAHLFEKHLRVDAVDPKVYEVLER